MDNLLKIATDIRVLGAEIGGNHHDGKESEELLKQIATRLEDISYSMVDNTRNFVSLSGVSNKGYKLYLRQKNIEELKRRKESEAEE